MWFLRLSQIHIKNYWFWYFSKKQPEGENIMAANTKAMQFIEDTLKREIAVPTRDLLDKGAKAGFSRHAILKALRVMPVTRKRSPWKNGERYVLKLNTHANDRRKTAHKELISDIRRIGRLIEDYCEDYPAYHKALYPVARFMQVRGAKRASLLTDPKSIPELSLLEYIAKNLGVDKKKPTLPSDFEPAKFPPSIFDSVDKSRRKVDDE